MDYGRLIREAWTLTWRYRFLWVLGLFAGGVSWNLGSGGQGMQYRLGDDDVSRIAPEAGAVATAIGQWVVANLGLVLAGVALLVVLGLVLIVVSFIAQGGITQATVDLATGQQSSLGRAWRAGLRHFWRFVGLALVLVLAAIVLAIVLGALVAGALLFVRAGGEMQEPRIVLLVLVLLIAVPVVIALAVGATIVVSFAQRTIVVANAGPVDALQAGWNLMRRHLGESLLIWLISIGLGIGASIVVAIVAGIVFVVLAAIGALIWSIAGLTAPTFVYGGLGLLVVIAAALLAVAIANTYFWNYWTIAYLQLRGQDEALPATA